MSLKKSYFFWISRTPFSAEQFVICKNIFLCDTLYILWLRQWRRIYFVWSQGNYSSSASASLVLGSTLKQRCGASVRLLVDLWRIFHDEVFPFLCHSIEFLSYKRRSNGNFWDPTSYPYVHRMILKDETSQQEVGTTLNSCKCCLRKKIGALYSTRHRATLHTVRFMAFF